MTEKEELIYLHAFATIHTNKTHIYLKLLHVNNVVFQHINNIDAKPGDVIKVGITKHGVIREMSVDN